MIQFTIDKNKLRAVAIAAATKDVRFYLNGIYFEIKNKSARLVATDGHRMHIGQTTIVDDLPEFSGIVPIAFIQNAIKSSKKAEFLVFSFADNTCSITANETTTQTKLIDGKFPDYCRAVPETISGQTAQYDYNYVVDAQEAAHLWSNNGLIPLQQNGTDAGIVSAPDGDFLAVIMSRRTKEAELAGIPKEFRKSLLRD